MTNEEIIRELEVLKEFFIEQSGSAYPVCLEYTIEKLSEKCDDCQEFDCSRCDMEDDLISRQAAIDYCYALINAENPSNPSDEWNYSQERINQTEVIIHHLEFMPSAQPERKKGKWIDAQYPYQICSICGIYFDTVNNTKNFCPNCGKEMRVEEDEAD